MNGSTSKRLRDMTGYQIPSIKDRKYMVNEAGVIYRAENEFRKYKLVKRSCRVRN